MCQCLRSINEIIRLLLLTGEGMVPEDLTNLTQSQVDKSRAELAKAEGKLDQYRKDATSATMKKIDEADRKVEEGASKAKSGISSWFGGK